MEVTTNTGSIITNTDSTATLWWIALFLWFGIHINIQNTGGTGLELPYNAIAWIFISAILSAALFHLAKTRKWHSDPVLKLLGVIMVTITLPIVFQESTEASLAGTRIFGIFSGLLLTILLYQCFQTEESWSKLLYILVIAGVLESLVCLVQQWAPALAAEVGVYRVDYGRPFGSFQQPNVSASLIATSLVCGLYLLLNQDLSSTSAIKTTIKKVIYTNAFLSASALVLLGSRTGLFGASLGCLLLLPLILSRLTQKSASHKHGSTADSSKRPFALWSVALISGIVLSVLSIQIQQTGGRNLEAFQSTENRTGIYQQAIDMITEKPLTGWGYGNFERSFLDFYADRYHQGTYTHRIIENLDHPHNELLLWAVEGGIIPPLLLIVLAIILLTRALKRLGAANGLATLALIIPLALHANTEYPFYQSSAHWFVFCVLVTWLIWRTGTPTSDQTKSTPAQTQTQTQTQTQIREFKLPFFAKSFALLIPLIVIPAMLLCLQATHQVTKYHASQRQHFEYLTDVIHPSGIWKRFFFDVMTYRLFQGMRTHQPDQVKAYIRWAEKFVTHTPRLSIYFNLANAYWAINNKEKSVQILEKAVYLYPHKNEAQTMLDRLNQERSNQKPSNQESSKE